MTSHSYNPFDFEFAKVQLFFQSDANSIHFFFYTNPFSRFNKGGKPLKEKNILYHLLPIQFFFVILHNYTFAHTHKKKLIDNPLWTTYAI